MTLDARLGSLQKLASLFGEIDQGRAGLGDDHIVVDQHGNLKEFAARSRAIRNGCSRSHPISPNIGDIEIWLDTISAIECGGCILTSHRATNQALDGGQVTKA